MWRRRKKHSRKLGAFIDDCSELEGRYTCSGTVMIDAKFKGEISSKDTLIIGDQGGRRYLGGAGDDFVAGMEGRNHLFGNDGSDLFAYFLPPSVFDKDVIMDLYEVSNDRIGFAREIYGAAADENGKPRLQFGAEATGDKATFLEYKEFAGVKLGAKLYAKTRSQSLGEWTELTVDTTKPDAKLFDGP